MEFVSEEANDFFQVLQQLLRRLEARGWFTVCASQPLESSSLLHGSRSFFKMAPYSQGSVLQLNQGKATDIKLAVAESKTLVVRCSVVVGHRTATSAATRTLHHTSTSSHSRHHRAHQVIQQHEHYLPRNYHNKLKEDDKALPDKQESRRQSLNRPDTGDTARGQPQGHGGL